MVRGNREKSDPQKQALQEVPHPGQPVGIKLYAMCLCSDLNFSVPALPRAFLCLLRKLHSEVIFHCRGYLPIIRVRKVTYFPFLLKVKPIYSK